MIAAVGLILVLQTTAVVAFGSYVHVVPSIFAGVVSVLGVRLSIDRLVAIIVSVVMASALLLLIYRTKIGQAMIALSQDADAAALQGINVNRIYSFGMGVGSALAAIAGGLMASILQVTPDMGLWALGKAIIVIILGGLGSILGTIIGGMFLGLIDGIGPVYIGSTATALLGYIIVILVLLIKPNGIFGRE
jgi:branched-chain amino acid transport system permease protein